MYRYIRSIHIHFTTISDPFIVSGKEAQRIYNAGKMYCDTPCMEVNFKHTLRVIPRNNILFMDIIENHQANQILKQLMQTFEAVQHLAQIQDDDWRRWSVKRNESYIKEDSGQYTKVSSDPQVARLVKEISHLEDQLKKAVNEKES